MLFVEMRSAFDFYLIKVCLEQCIRGIITILTWSTLQIRISNLSLLLALSSLLLFYLMHCISTVGYYYCIATDSRICWNALHFSDSVPKEILGNMPTLSPFTL